MPTIPGPVVIEGSGGFDIGSSYLNATNAGSSGAAGGVTVPWTLAAGAGSDIAIDGGDSTKTNILTTGWYSINFHSDVFPDSGVLTGVTLRLTLNGFNPVDMLVDEGPSIPGGMDDYENSVIEPGRLFSAGDFIGCRIIAQGIPTFSYAETRLAVLRLA